MGNKLLKICDPKEDASLKNQTADIAGKIGKSLAPFNPSNDFVIETALRFLEVGVIASKCYPFSHLLRFSVWFDL